MTAAEDGWFLLNPSACFKLHVSGLNADTVARLQRALRKGVNLAREAEQPVLGILAKAQAFRCREIDEFQACAEPIFTAAVQRLLAGSSDWPELVRKGDAATNRRRRLLQALEEQVIRESGETYRYLPGLLAEDVEVRRRTIATLLCLTYAMAERQTRHAVRREEFAAPVRAWTFMRMPGGCCPTCKQIPEQLAATPLPVVPVHVACGCSVHPVLR
jgi:hypothetical protein